ncbi:hypothetical protein [Mucilaginibacter sp.]|uniref:hypothetical protein n=1 Tax=Mucilaginibacter sp. TaxID=1882438 RepID=UPI002ED27559
MKIVISLAFIFLFSINVQSQELLDKRKAAIDKYSKAQNSKLAFDKIITGIGDNPFRMLVYTFNATQAAKNGVYEMTFHLEDGKCFRYLIAYNSNNYKAPLIRKFDAPGSGLKRENEKLVWKNKSKKFEISMADTRKGSIQAAMFMLVISKI